tara:strand:- start:1040 stop:1969 length:930 start_codon:yes stop_codon:yes gene_type:complete
MLNKPKFWDKKIGLISIVLLPLSFIYNLIIFFKKKFTKMIKFETPIICIGNIYIGGTGKTPTSIFLANELKKIGKKPAIIRKYYKSHTDEYNLIRNYFKNLIINNDRVSGLLEAKNNGYNILILDDGLQDYRIKKSLSIVCFNQNQLIGNGLVLPSGPLRESLSSLKNTNIVIINGKNNLSFEEKILKINKDLNIFYSSYKPMNIDQFKNKKLLAIAGIGNPENFFQLLKENNLTLKKKRIFPDHYQFSKKEIQNIVNEAKIDNYQIIMTEKDYYKIKDFKIEGIEYLKVSIEIENIEKILKLIEEIYD